MEKNYTMYNVVVRFENPYICSRNGGDRVVNTFGTIKEAQKYLLNKFNELSDKYAYNWGMACMISRNCIECCVGGGINSKFYYDSRVFEIEETEL